MANAAIRAKGALEVAKIRQRELLAQGREDEASMMDFHIADLSFLVALAQGNNN